MIRYIENEHINKLKWDRCIGHSVNSRIYAYSWYLDIVAPEWSAYVLDDYHAVFPIFTQKKWGVSYCFQPVFTQQLGLFTPLLLTSKLLEPFLKKIQQQFPLVQINLNSHNKISASVFRVEKRVNHELDLISPYEELKKAYSKNLKRNIKKAQKENLTIFKNLKPDAIIQLFKNNKGKEIKAYSEEDYQKLLRLIYKAIGLSKASVWGVFTAENNLCAGAIFMKDQHKHTFLFSATNAEAKKLSAMPFLIDHFIDSHSQTKNILDFEGSNDPNLARFYKSFGASKIHYPHFFCNHLPWYLSVAWKLKRKFS